jgi:hypothetical protein
MNESKDSQKECSGDAEASMEDDSIFNTQSLLKVLSRGVQLQRMMLIRQREL